MDTKLIKEFGSEILCYKLKTARQKKRDVKTGEEKKLLRLNREHIQIRRQQRDMGFIVLDPPIIKGWKRYFVLREDVTRSKEAIFYQNILDKINTTEYCKRKDFKKKPKFSRKRKNWELIEQTVMAPEHKDFVKMNFSEKEKALFEEKFIKHKLKNELIKVFVFKEQWRFVLRVRQNIITKVKAVDAELKKRENEIWDYLMCSNKWDQLSHLLGNRVSRWKKWGRRPKGKYDYKKKFLEDFLEEKNIVDANTSTQKLA